MGENEAFIRAVTEAAAGFTKIVKDNVVLFHHNDADGLSSGAILTHAFERQGLQVRRFCLEKPYPEVLKIVFQDVSTEPQTGLVFTDFGSGMLPELVALNQNNLPLFVIDHHAVTPASDTSLFLLNCTSFGIASDPNCSASSIAYLFARALDSINADLAVLGVLGAVGDGLFDNSGMLTGINSLVAEDALKQRRLKFSNGEYHVCHPDWVPARSLAAEVNSLGGFGYLRGGPDIAVKGLREGRGAAFSAFARNFRQEFEAAFQELISRDFLHQEVDLQWFELGATFTSFGVKTVGLVCEELITRALVDTSKYLAGFQKVADEIPGLGQVQLQQLKISMRLPPHIKQEVINLRRSSLDIILPEATRKVRGFVDACHPHAAATTIPIGSQGKFMAELKAAIATRTQH